MRVTVVRATDFLVPGGTLLVELFVATVAFLVLVVWPIVGAAHRSQWAWMLAVAVLGPIAGIAWLAIGRRARPLQPVG